MSRPSRPTVLYWAAVIVSATALLCAASTAQARPSSAASPHATAAPISTAGINVNSASDTGASDVSDLGSAGWALSLRLGGRRPILPMAAPSDPRRGRAGEGG